MLSVVKEEGKCAFERALLDLVLHLLCNLFDMCSKCIHFKQ